MGITINIRPEDLPKELESVGERLPRAIRSGLWLASQRGRAYLVRQSPADTGQFKNSWRVDDSGVYPTIVNDAPHAGIIEAGARPHSVNREGVQAITEWCRRHVSASRAAGRRIAKANYIAKYGSNKGFSTIYRSAMRGRSSLDQEASSMAWAIITNLKKYGQKGKFIVRDGMPNLARFAREEIVRRIKTEMGWR